MEKSTFISGRKAGSFSPAVLLTLAGSVAKSLLVSAAILASGIGMMGAGWTHLGTTWLFLGAFCQVAWSYRKPWKITLFGCVMAPVVSAVSYLLQLVVLDYTLPPLTLLVLAIIAGGVFGWWRTLSHRLQFHNGAIFAHRTIGYLAAWASAYVFTQALALSGRSLFLIQGGMLTGAFTTTMLVAVSITLLQKRNAILGGRRPVPRGTAGSPLMTGMILIGLGLSLTTENLSAQTPSPSELADILVLPSDFKINARAQGVDRSSTAQGDNFLGGGDVAVKSYNYRTTAGTLSVGVMVRVFPTPAEARRELDRPDYVRHESINGPGEQAFQGSEYRQGSTSSMVICFQEGRFVIRLTTLHIVNPDGSIMGNGPTERLSKPTEFLPMLSAMANAASRRLQPYLGGIAQPPKGPEPAARPQSAPPRPQQLAPPPKPASKPLPVTSQRPAAGPGGPVASTSSPLSPPQAALIAILTATLMAAGGTTLNAAQALARASAQALQQAPSSQAPPRTITLTGDAARQALRAGIGSSIGIPEAERWGLSLDTEGRPPVREDNFGPHGRIQEIGPILTDEDGNLVITVDVTPDGAPPVLPVSDPPPADPTPKPEPEKEEEIQPEPEPDPEPKPPQPDPQDELQSDTDRFNRLRDGAERFAGRTPGEGFDRIDELTNRVVSKGGADKSDIADIRAELGRLAQHHQELYGQRAADEQDYLNRLGWAEFGAMVALGGVGAGAASSAATLWGLKSAAGASAIGSGFAGGGLTFLSEIGQRSSYSQIFGQTAVSTVFGALGGGLGAATGATTFGAKRASEFLLGGFFAGGESIARDKVRGDDTNWSGAGWNALMGGTMNATSGAVGDFFTTRSKTTPPAEGITITYTRDVEVPSGTRPHGDADVPPPMADTPGVPLSQGGPAPEPPAPAPALEPASGPPAPEPPAPAPALEPASGPPAPEPPAPAPAPEPASGPPAPEPPAPAPVPEPAPRPPAPEPPPSAPAPEIPPPIQNDNPSGQSPKEQL